MPEGQRLRHLGLPGRPSAVQHNGGPGFYLFYRRLIALRKQYPAFRDGSFTLLDPEDKNALPIPETRRQSIGWWCAVLRRRHCRRYVRSGSGARRSCCPTIRTLPDSFVPTKPAYFAGKTDMRFAATCLLTEMLRKWYNHPNRVSWEQPQDVPEAEPLL